MGNGIVRPQNFRFSSAAVEAVWAGIEALDFADQLALVERLAYRVSVEPFLKRSVRTREERAILALREARETLGRSPSRREYKKLQQQNAHWPDHNNVQAWLGAGRWNAALERAGLIPTQGGDEVFLFRRRYGVSFTAEECIEAVQAAAAELGHAPSFNDYRAWANRPNVQQRPGRRPLSKPTFIRVLGSWVNTLRAAGLVTGNAHPGCRGVIRPLGRFSREDAVRAIRAVAKQLGHSPNMTEYERVRSEIIAESLAAGDPQAFPSCHVMYRFFGGRWANALVAASLRVEGHIRDGGYSNEEIFRTLRRAAAELGAPFTSTAYGRWRKQKLDEAERGGDVIRVASLDLIRRRFATWGQALKQAQIRPDGGRA